MKIRQLRVDGFGTWTDLDLKGLAEPLIVFYGENEAGKTTLMQFVRGMLYGFSPERRTRYLPPVSGGRSGGALWVDVAQQQFVIERHAPRHSDEDQVQVTDSQGVSREGRPLALLLDGVDESIFNNVFAFGLGEIQELATLTDSAAADLLYELTLGLDRVSLTDVMHELENSRRRLLAEVGGTGQIADLTAERDRLRGELGELKLATPRYLELVHERQQLDRAAADFEEQERALERRGQTLSVALQIEPRWRSRQDLDRRLTALGSMPHIADDCLPTLDDLKARLQTRRNRLERITARRKERIGEMRGLKINEALCRQAPRLEALAEQQQWIAALDAQAKQIEAELAGITSQHLHDHDHDHSPKHAPQASHSRSAEERRPHREQHSAHEPRNQHQAAKSRHEHKPSGAGKPTHEHRSSDRTAAGEHRAAHAPSAFVPVEPLSAQTVGALRAQGKALGELRQRVRKAHADKSAARASAHGIKRKIEADLGDAAEEPLSGQLERAGNLVSQLRRRVQIDERLDQLDRRRHELDEKSHESLDRQVPPTWQVISHGTFFASGVGLVLASVFLPASILHGYGMVVGFLGLGAAALGWVMTYASHHMSGQQFDDCQKRLDQLKDQVASAEKERDELDKQLPKGGGPLVARLQAAEKEHARLEELMPLDTHHQHGVRSYKVAKDEHRSIDREYRKARARWRHSLSQAGLPEDLTPRTLRDAVERGKQLLALNKQVEDRRAQLIDCRRQHEILADRIVQVAVDARVEFDHSDPLALLREMLRELQDEQLRLHNRDQMRAALVRLRRLRRKLARQVITVNQRLTDLVRANGARDEADLRRRIALLEEARGLEHSRQMLDDEIAAVLAGHEEPHEIEACLDDSLNHGHELRQLLEAVAADKLSLRGRLGKVWEERGALLEQIKALAADRRIAEHHWALAQVKAQLREATRRWQVLCACSAALESVREAYERQRQPEVLREASQYFASLTGGRYTRAWTSLGHRVLWVDDADGKPLSVDKLSRGTREQLFLSLRLALVSAYARRGVRLPIVMDDVLVNFDVGRVKAAVDVLREFVRAGHQVFVFTCHEHIASLFRRGQVPVRALPGNFLRVEETPEPRPDPPRVVPAPHFLPLLVEDPPLEPSEDELMLADDDELPSPPQRVVPLVPLPTEALPIEALAAEPEVSHPVQLAPLPPVAPRRNRPVRARRPRPQAEPVQRSSRSKVRLEQWVDSVPWSAEEFDGELADRVRRSEPIVEYVEQPSHTSAAATHDDEPLEVQFEEDSRYQHRNGQRH